MDKSKRYLQTGNPEILDVLAELRVPAVRRLRYREDIGKMHPIEAFLSHLLEPYQRLGEWYEMPKSILDVLCDMSNHEAQVTADDLVMVASKSDWMAAECEVRRGLEHDLGPEWATYVLMKAWDGKDTILSLIHI